MEGNSAKAVTLGIHVLFDLTILLLGVYITDTFTHMHTQLCTAVFVAAFFFTAKDGEQLH